MPPAELMLSTADHEIAMLNGTLLDFRSDLAIELLLRLCRF